MTAQGTEAKVHQQALASWGAVWDGATSNSSGGGGGNEGMGAAVTAMCTPGQAWDGVCSRICVWGEGRLPLWALLWAPNLVAMALFKSVILCAAIQWAWEM